MRLPKNESEHLANDDPFSCLLMVAQDQLQKLSDTLKHLAEQNTKIKADEDPNNLILKEGERCNKLTIDLQPLEKKSAAPKPFPFSDVYYEIDVDNPSDDLEDCSDPNSALLHACAKNNLEDVSNALRQGASPNIYVNFVCFRKEFRYATPLGIAVLKGNLKIVNLLCEYQADPNANYSFDAGVQQILWTGPISFATTVSGDLPLLRNLISHQADVHKIASNGATLAWQATYMGQTEILQTVIEMRADIEAKATNVDDEKLTHSPLHIAAIAGKFSCLKLLVQSKAHVDVDDGNGHYALDDAILNGHADALKLLVSSGADPWRQIDKRRHHSLMRHASMKEPAALAGQRDFNPSEELASTRCMDVLFASGNPLNAAALLQGLRFSPKTIDKMSIDDFVKFLKSGGAAPLHLMDAVFQPYTPKLWSRSDDGKLTRMQLHSAFMPKQRGMIIKAGPHVAELEDLFNKKQTPTDEIKLFLDSIAPSFPRYKHQHKRERREMYTPITTLMCHVARVHEHPEILHAIIYSPCIEIFETTGCKAIIQFHWVTMKSSAIAYTAMTFIEVINFFLINIVLNVDLGSDERDIQRETALEGANIVAFGVSLVVLILQALKLVGYHYHGLFRERIHSFDFWYRLLVLTMTIGVNVSVRMLGLHARGSRVFCVCFGLVIISKWSYFLSTLMRTASFVGEAILPILETMFDIGPFCGVLCIILLALTNLYYALGISDLYDSLMLMYRLAVVVEADQWEMEGKSAPLGIEANRTTIDAGIQAERIVALTPEKTVYYYTIRCIYMAVSFLIGISMMNVFIAVLCEKYASAAAKAEAAFVRERACMVLDMDAIRQGFRCVLRCCGRRKTHEKEGLGHLWIAQPSEL